MRFRRKQREAIVKFWYNGCIVPEEDIIHLPINEDFHIESYYYAFIIGRYYSVKKHGKILTSHIEYEDPMYFIDATILTLDEIKEKYPERETLIMNIRGEKYEKAIMGRTGGSYTYDGVRKVISEKDALELLKNYKW